MKNNLNDIPCCTEIILDGADSYNLISASNLAGRGIIEHALFLLFNVAEVSDYAVDYNTGDEGVTFIDGGGSLVIDLALEIPGELAAVIDVIADERGISFPEAVTNLLLEGLYDHE